MATKLAPREIKITFDPGYLRAKRALDLLFTLLILPFLGVIVGLVGLAIRLDSDGPIFYRQRRVGLNGQEFYMFKFRSMYHNRDDTFHREYVTQLMQNEGRSDDKASLIWEKAKNDHRVTRVGRVLRRTSLDELPQFFNVLRGEMTLVGPRPTVPYEVKHYQPRDWLRHAGKPGLTGSWQVYARYQVSFQDMVDLDIAYLLRQSLWQDLKLILLTVPAMWRGHGAIAPAPEDAPGGGQSPRAQRALGFPEMRRRLGWEASYHQIATGMGGAYCQLVTGLGWAAWTYRQLVTGLEWGAAYHRLATSLEWAAGAYRRLVTSPWWGAAYGWLVTGLWWGASYGWLVISLGWAAYQRLATSLGRGSVAPSSRWQEWAAATYRWLVTSRGGKSAQAAIDMAAKSLRPAISYSRSATLAAINIAGKWAAASYRRLVTGLGWAAASYRRLVIGLVRWGAAYPARRNPKDERIA